MQYLHVKNWEKFQHYKDRNPPWIKLHFEIMTSTDWVMLADASKLLAIVCMMIASRNSGQIPNDPNYIKRVAYLDKAPNLTPLIECGFLINPLAHASTPQADARPETETYSTETEGIAKKEAIPKRARKKISYSENFESFWKIYPPNGASKDEAQKSYNRAITEGENHELIERSVGAYAAYLSRTDTKPAHATTWLNQRRWSIDYGSQGHRNQLSPPANAKPTFTDEGKRIAADFLAQPRRQSQAGAGSQSDLRITEAVRQNDCEPENAG